MKEEWKDVVGYEGIYKISNLGRILSVRFNRLITPSPYSDGYLGISIKGKTKYIHRLIAEAFIPNPDSKPLVDHIDRNKLNNSISNLRWVTVKENNLNHDPYVRHKLNSRSKTVCQYSLTGTLLGKYDSITTASKSINGHRRHIAECCYGKRNHSSGYVWRFEGDDFYFNPKSKTVKEKLLEQYK